MHRRHIRRLSASLFFGLCLAACAPPAPPSILLVTVDTLRADRLGCYGYFRNTTPALDALAADGLLFERAVAPMATTLPSHVSLLTGTNPARHGVMGNLKHFQQPLESSDRLQTFAQMLQRAGYTTAAFVGAAPLKADSGIAVGFDQFDEPRAASRRADAVVARASDWLAARPPGPFFLWLHIWDPHSPYTPPRAFRGRFQGDADRLTAYLRELGVPNLDDPRTRRRQDLYDGEVCYTDTEIGRLIATLRELRLYDDLAIVVAGDHGEGLGQHDWLSHGEIYDEQLFVPLLMKLPAARGVRGRRVAGVAALIDVVPTLIGALELPVAAADRRQFEGIDLLARGAEHRRPFVFSQRVPREEIWGTDQRYALTGVEWKYLHDSQGDDELYRLSTDPHERHNLIGEEPERARALKARIDDLLAGYARLRPGLESSDEITDQRRRELKALGYVN